MKVTLFGAVLAAVVLAGCQRSQQPATSGNTAMPAADYERQLAALPEASRDGVFMRAITDAGFDCQKVESAATHAPVEGRPAWAVQCEHDRRYVMLINPGGIVQVVRGHFENGTGG